MEQRLSGKVAVITGGGVGIGAATARRLAAPRMVSYVTTKTAVIGLARSIAYEFGPDNIRANTICPGWIRTEMSQRGLEVVAGMKSKSAAEVKHDITRRFPLRRLGEPSEIAACVEFLVSDDASFVTGATLVADGGDSIVEMGCSEMAM